MELFGSDAVDERLVEIVARLNDMGLKTMGSCQGNDNEEDYKNNVGHPNYAYIRFLKPLPEDLFAEFKKDTRLIVDDVDCYVGAAAVMYHQIFPELVGKVLDVWAAECRPLSNYMRLNN